MPSQTLYPDAVLDSTNYSTLNVGDIDDPGWTRTSDDDDVFGTWDGNGNTNCQVSFATPTGNPTTGAGLQLRLSPNASPLSGLLWAQLDRRWLPSEVRLERGDGLLRFAGTPRRYSWSAQRFPPKQNLA